MKAMHPEKYDPKTDNFKSWCEDLERWIKSEDENLADLFRQAATAKDVVELPVGPELENIRFAYSHLRKLMGNKEAKQIVRGTRRDNALEAYRLLNRRYNPRSRPP